MKRDVDYARQILFDLEAQGADCSLAALRTGLAHDTDERLRHHVRLLIDGGLVKEIDRTSTGVPCVRLTSAGHELIELCRNEGRWRRAKWVVQENTGGLSLTVLRVILTRWAVQAATYGEGYRPRRRALPTRARREVVRREPTYAPEEFEWEEPTVVREELPRRRPAAYREQYAYPERFDRYAFEVREEASETQVGVSLPIHMI